MSRIIIENRSNINDMASFEYVKAVMREGRVSNYGSQYCYFTVFKDGVTVSSFLNKKSDRFVICNEEK